MTLLCDCEEGWTDNACDTAICKTGCMYGSCDDNPGECNCNYGWTGDLCSTGLGLIIGVETDNTNVVSYNPSTGNATLLPALPTVSDLVGVVIDETHQRAFIQTKTAIATVDFISQKFLTNWTPISVPGSTPQNAVYSESLDKIFLIALQTNWEVYSIDYRRGFAEQIGEQPSGG
eukprot:CAMPEP_0174257672 /NCGR_PEP_ID=MMETSP0439-20130205/6785_1 /TAXON_ID=0 /ORGANISM="Stereomyxa ramosa, Strain Chinc5" /LENGTH=174 /DNA_ID=CAMNT_0015340865 /DNA_START=934 /DNA_END=1455 /DNA_ORIENTATION=-